MRDITIKDVAREAGVSISIVSFAINNVKGRVSPEVRAHVLKCAEKLKYMPNTNAQRLKTKENNTILLVYSEDFLLERNASTVQFIVGVLTYAKECGKDVLVKLIKDENINYKQELREYQKIWNSRRCEGIIFECKLENEIGDKFFRELFESGVNFVNVSRFGKATGYSCVYMDEYYTIVELVQFIYKKGYKEIYYLTRYTNNPVQRERGYLDAMRELNLKGEPLYYKNIHRKREELWSILEPVVKNRKQHIAIACWNDNDAINVVEILQSKGIHVPSEVGVVGFDDLPIAQHLSPKLTTVSQPFEEMAYHSLQILQDAYKYSERKISSVQVFGKIVERQSL